METTLKRSYKSNILFFCVVIICVSVTLLYPLCANLINNRSNFPKVSDGKISFAKADLDSGKEYFLNGTWEFYWHQFIVSDENADLAYSTYPDVPISRLDYLSFQNEFSEGGYGSYRLVFSDMAATQPITFYISNFAGAYNIYLDGHLITSCGEISSDKDSTVASIRRTSLPVTVDSGTHEIVIELSTSRMNGLYMSPAVRNYEANENYTLGMLGVRYAFVGIILFCGIFMLIMKLSINRDIYSLWGVGLCIMLAFRMMISNEGYMISQPLFFGLSYEYMTIMIFAATFIIKLTSLIYLTRVLPFKVSPTSLIEFAALFITVVFIAIFFKNTIYNPYYSVILQFFTYTLDLYILEKLSTCVVNKVRDSLPYLLAYALVAIGISVDFLYTNGIILFRCSMFMPFTFFIFAIAIVYVHARNTAVLYRTSLKTAKLETELSDANMAIMVSQIQPHFLYNALNTIKYLMRTNPQLAEKAIVEFSLYLRGNMDSLTQKKPILFKTELDHIKHYCEIELMRFNDKLDIEYDIQTDNFYVPTLSIQPLVENSIKHGVTKKANGGTVTLSTYQDNDNFYVKIEDDGVGFDMNKLPNDDRSHIGFANIKSRLETMLHADISMQSTQGVGTNVLITLPKEYNIGNINNE